VTLAGLAVTARLRNLSLGGDCHFGEFPFSTTRLSALTSLRLETEDSAIVAAGLERLPALKELFFDSFEYVF
jgi:hypothetical protein